MTQAEINAAKALIEALKAETQDGAITPNRLGNILLKLIVFINDNFDTIVPSATIDTKISNATTGLVNSSAVSTLIAAALTNYYTKSAVYNKTEIDNAHYTKNQIENKGYITTDTLVQSIVASGVLNKYAKTDDLPNMSLYATKAMLDEVESTVDDLTDDVSRKANKTELSSYAKLTDIPSLDEYAKTEDIPSLDGYAKTTDIPDTSGLATKTSVNTVASKQTTMESQITNLGVKAVTENADTLTLTARYLMNTGSTNVPFTPCYMEVLAASTSFIVQEVVSNSGVKKTRVYNGSSWSEWA